MRDLLLEKNLKEVGIAATQKDPNEEKPRDKVYMMFIKDDDEVEDKPAEEYDPE